VSPELKTVGDLLYWSYANLAMAHAAIGKGESRYSRRHYMVRARLLKGLRGKTMSVGSIVDDERVKMEQGVVCCYCGSSTAITMDHLLPKRAGGFDSADNIVWACRSCNSAKGATDVLVWYQQKKVFPPLLILRRYLKLAIAYCYERGSMDVALADAPEVPFRLDAVPIKYPQPAELVLRVES